MEYEIGTSLSQIRNAKKNAEAYAISLRSAVPPDDPFAKAKVDEEIKQLAQTYVELEDEEARLQKVAQERVATGKYRNEGPTMVPGPGEMRETGFKIPDTKQKLKAHIGFALGVEPDKIDLNAGAPWGVRARAAFLTAEKKPELYKSEYGEENVVTMNVDGKPANFIKQGDKFILADEQDLTLADVGEVAGGVTSEILPIAGAMLGGLALAPSIPGAAISSAAGYTAGGTISDSIAEAVLLPEKNRRSVMGDVLGQRSLEGLSGIPIDIGIGMAAKPFLKRIGAQGQRPAAVELMDKTLKDMEKSGKISKRLAKRLDPLANAPIDDQVSMLQIAQKNPGGSIGRQVYEARDLLETFKNGVATKEAGLPKSMFKKSIDNMMAAEEVAIARINEVDPKLAAVLEKERKAKVDALLNGPTEPTEVLGNTLMNLVKDEAGRRTSIKNGLYSSFYEKADQAGVQFDPEEIANAIVTTTAQNPAMNSSVVDGVVAELRNRRTLASKAAELEQRIPTIQDPVVQARAIADLQKMKAQSGPLTAKDLHDYQLRITADIPEGSMIQPSGAQVQSKTVAPVIDSFFKTKINQAGLSESWDVATTEYLKKLETDGGILKSIGAEHPGGFAAMTPTQIVDTVLADPKHVDTVIGVMPPEMQLPMRARLQNAYLKTVGVGSETGTGLKELRVNDDMVRKLWGTNSKGEVNEVYGQRMIEKIQTLNSELKKIGGDASKLTFQELWQLSTVLSNEGIKDTAKLLAKKSAELGKIEKIQNNELMKAAVSSARQGDLSVMDVDAFPRAVFDEQNTGRINDLVSYMTPADMEALKVKTMGHFFRRYALENASVKNDFGFTPWDFDKFLLDIEKNPALATNLKKIVGADGFDELVETSRLAQIVRPVAVNTKQAISPRAVANTTKASFYIAGDIPSAIRSGWLTALYTGGQLMPTVRKAMARRVSQADFKKNMREANSRLFATSKGIQAAMMVGARDPRLMEFYANAGIGPEWLQEAQEFREQYGTDTGLDFNRNE